MPRISREKRAEYNARYAAKNKAYQLANKERIYLQNKAYRLGNPEKERARAARYYQTHKKEMTAYSKKWRMLNRERSLLIQIGVSARRRARHRKAAGSFTTGQLAARVAFFGGRCAYCRGPFEHVDHVIPLARGGSNWPANLRPSCASCNSSKGQKTVAEWLSQAAIRLSENSDVMIAKALCQL